MNRWLMSALACLVIAPAWGQGRSAALANDMPEVEKIRFCERVRDQALLALYSRDQGRPMRLIAEDGSAGARISNHITRRIYQEPQINSPSQAHAFGRATCIEMMGVKTPPE
ncbi:hypothetical protein [Dechloromonas sp. A34]|uniref:hypothetical protein n=1 Tax=Dechloromonas sp. A34 TaxID=447588 RepID=UPI00224888B6|nr:hypothetical protein [Dechloromonas sp. A34]